VCSPTTSDGFVWTGRKKALSILSVKNVSWRERPWMGQLDNMFLDKPIAAVCLGTVINPASGLQLLAFWKNWEKLYLFQQIGVGYRFVSLYYSTLYFSKTG